MDITLLEVLHISQVGPNANRFKNDCGPACASMLIQAYTKTSIPPDVLFSKITQEDRYISASELVTLLAGYNIPCEWKTFNVTQLLDSLHNHKPIIALVKYGVLRKKGYGAPGSVFDGPHWVVVVGIDLDYVIIHDSLRTDNAPTRVKLDVWLEAWDDVGRDSNPSFGGIVPLMGIDNFVVEKKAKVICSALNVRNGPGMQYKVIDALTLGSIVSIMEEVGDWFRHGENRWSHLGYVQRL